MLASHPLQIAAKGKFLECDAVFVDGPASYPQWIL